MEINKQKLPTLVKEKPLNGVIEKKQETLSKAKRITWGVLALVILSVFLAVFWCLIINEPKENLPIDITEQVAIKIANQFLQQKCDVNFSGIEKVGISRTLIYTAGKICSGLGDYASKYYEIWTANYSLKSVSEEDKSISIAVLVGLDGNFICGYAIDSRAAPGILSLDEVCSQKDNVVVATDKTEYEQGEPVNITLSRSDKTIYVEFRARRYAFYQLRGDTWEELTTDCETNCIMTCKNGTLEQGPCAQYVPPQYYFSEYNGPWEIQWNQKECIYETKLCGNKNYSEGSLMQVSTGKFKVEFCYFDKGDVDLSAPPGNAPSDKKKCVEREFTIKEKSAVNPLCSEKVQGFGLCKAIFEGYEFDSDSGKCVKKGVSGCNANIPFRILEECQKTCEKEVDFYSCNQDSDCIKVQADCCGCSGGGKAVAINKNFEKEWKNKLASECKEKEMCPAVESNDPSCFQEPVCVNNKCVLLYPDVSFKDKCDVEDGDSDIARGGFTENNPDLANIRFQCEQKSDCEWRPLGGKIVSHFACCPKDLNSLTEEEIRSIYGRCILMID